MILEAIADGALGFIDIWIAMSLPETGFGASITRTQRKIDQLQEARTHNKLAAANKHKLTSLISKLKKEGYIKPKLGTIGELTEKGMEKIKKLRTLLLRKKSYKKTENDFLKIFTFDIPVRFNKYRDWIRFVLISLDYVKIQKSVFIGKSRLPEEFIQDLADLELLSYIHIFKITKSGTIENLVI